MSDTPVDKGISDAKLADLVTLHERQRAMHAERHEIKAEYQRQGEGVWVLVRKGDGFA